MCAADCKPFGIKFRRNFSQLLKYFPHILKRHRQRQQHQQRKARNVDMKVELITPIAIENGLRFAIREGGRTVGSGVVISIEE